MDNDLTNNTVTIYSIYQSIEKEGMFSLEIKNTEDAIDIIKKLSSELLSFHINTEELKLIREKVTFEEFYYGNIIHSVDTDLGFKSNVGRIRDLDEDSIVVVTTDVIHGENCSLLVLGDGVGGHNKGEVASYLGTKVVAEELIHLMVSISEKTDNEIESSIIYSLKEANRAISDHVKIHPEYDGMATTIVVALLKGQQLYIGNVGDSRAYIISNEIRQITKDHSLVQEMVEADRITKEEARTHPQKNIMTRAIGYYQDIDVDIFKEKIYKGDVIMLCCDGLTNVIRDDDIKDVISKNKNCSNASNELIRMANEKGGPDNISVIVFRPNNLAIKYMNSLPIKKAKPKEEPQNKKIKEKSIKEIKIRIEILAPISIILLSSLIGFGYYIPKETNEKLIVDYYAYMNTNDYKRLPTLCLNDSNASTNITKFAYFLKELNETFKAGFDSKDRGFEIISIKRDGEQYIIEVNDTTKIYISQKESNIPIFYANSTVKYYTKTNNTGFIYKIFLGAFSEWKISDIKWYNNNGEKESYIHAKEFNYDILNNYPDMKTIIDRYYPSFKIYD